MNYIVAFVILITVVVFIHEYGHYYFAKKYGVGVTDFSIGFGKEIFGFNDKNGTKWKFCLIPLGGYVKFFKDMSNLPIYFPWIPMQYCNGFPSSCVRSGLVLLVSRLEKI